MIVFFFSILPQKEKETNDAFLFVVDIFFEGW